MPEYALGEWVSVIGRLEREGDETNTHRWWQRFDWNGVAVPVMVVGQRTLSNGTVDRYTESDGWGPSYTVKTWCPSEYFNAYLVTVGLRNKPFYVLPDQIKEA